MKKILMILSCSLFLSPSFAASKVCYRKAGEYYGLPASLLKAIAMVESRERIVVRKNPDSEDIGVMQINSWWLPKLVKYGITRESLLDPCTNIFVGAWILRHCINQYGYNWQAIGCYHSQNPEKQLEYARKVYKELRRIK